MIAIRVHNEGIGVTVVDFFWQEQAQIPNACNSSGPVLFGELSSEPGGEGGLAPPRVRFVPDFFDGVFGVPLIAVVLDDEGFGARAGVLDDLLWCLASQGLRRW